MQSYILFQFFGIFPFTIHHKHVFYSKFWHFWSIFINLTIITVSIIRIFLFWDWYPEPNNIGFIYQLASKYEPHLLLFEIVLAGFVVLCRSKLYEYVKVLVKLSLSSHMINWSVLALIGFLCGLIVNIHIFYNTSLDSELDVLDSWFAVMQSVYNLMQLLHIMLSLYVINSNLSVQRKRLLERNSCYHSIFIQKKVLTEVDTIISLYSQFSNIFDIFLKTFILEQFYDTLVGIKIIYDMSYSWNDKNFHVESEVTVTVWYLYGTPLIFFVMYQGDLIQKKVRNFILKIFLMNF